MNEYILDQLINQLNQFEAVTDRIVINEQIDTIMNKWMNKLNKLISQLDQFEAVSDRIVKYRNTG